MHHFDDAPTPTTPADPNYRWYRELNRYHWFVLTVAALGWLFDCLDQQLFILARQPAMTELLTTISDAGEQIVPNRQQINEAAGYATSIFLLGWATGGLFFGVLGDRIGRAKTMMLTILLYSLFTGLSALSVGFWDFALYRFLTGLGVGGEFAVGVALVAEVMPNRARPYALSMLQAFSAVGNVSAALIGMGMGALKGGGVLESLGIDSVWRPMFVIGAVPALLALVIRRRLKEPERWQQATGEGVAKAEVGSYASLFRDPILRKHALLGLVLAFSGVVGLWGVGFFTMDLVGDLLTKRFTAEGFSPQEVAGKVATWKGITSLMINVGAFLGMCSFGLATARIGRRPAFAIAFVAAFASTVMVFALLDQFAEIFWMVPIMGFCQLSLFAGYAIYFPELFPTRLRSTGTSFCYNVGRFLAAGGPGLLGYLTANVYANEPEPLRNAGLTVCGVFLVGLLALPFLPETKGKPLPE